MTATVVLAIDDNLSVVPSRLAAIELREPFNVVQGPSAGWRIVVLLAERWTTLKDFGDDEFGARAIYLAIVQAL